MDSVEGDFRSPEDIGLDGVLTCPPMNKLVLD